MGEHCDEDPELGSVVWAAAVLGPGSRSSRYERMAELSHRCWASSSARTGGPVTGTHGLSAGPPLDVAASCRRSCPQDPPLG